MREGVAALDVEVQLLDERQLDLDELLYLEGKYTPEGAHIYYAEGLSKNFGSASVS